MISRLLNTALVLAITFAGASAPADAETYTWTDETGTVNFTDNPSSVPRKYRKKLKRIQDVPSDEPRSGAPAPASSPQPSNPSPASRQSQEVPPSRNATDAGQTFGGKTFEQWKQGLAEKEATLNDLHRRIDEIDRVLKRPSASADQYRKMIDERNRLTDRFNELKKQYDAYVETARKAGVRIEPAR